MCIVVYAADSHPTYKLCVYLAPSTGGSEAALVHRLATRSARAYITLSPVLCVPSPDTPCPSLGRTSILVSNRDEFLHRPTSPAAWRRSLAHPSAAAPALAVGGEGDVLCGLDAVGGGTWLGLAKDGRLGVL
jgi:hypothetical protein